MSLALNLPHRMTVAEFEGWAPPVELANRRWQLIDGEPVCMAPPSVDHGAIQNEIGRLLANHLAATGPGCRVITTPGVIPRVRSETNERVPDLAVTCAPVRAERTLSEPLLLIEILSPSNEATTRANVWAYTSLPTVREVLLLSSVAIRAELLRRDAEGAWPEMPQIVADAQLLQLESIGFEAPVVAFYATSSLH